MRATTRTKLPLPGTVIDPLYSDWMRKPMGDTDYQSLAMTLLKEALDDFFHDDPRVYVAMNLVFYYRRGQPRSRRDPDVLVARGVVGKHLRRSFRVWEEGVLPCTLFEISSKGTWRTDVGAKRLLYARLNIPEYFVFDPEDRYLDPVLRGFRTVNRRPVEMTPAADGSLVSQELGLRLKPEGTMLRLFDLRTGEPILTRAEQIEAERRQRDVEIAERDAEITRLLAKLEQQKRRK